MSVFSTYKTLPVAARAVVAISAGVAVGIAIFRTVLAFAPFQPPAGVTYWEGSLAYINWVKTLTTNDWYILLATMLGGSFAGGFVTQKLTPPVNFPPPLITGFTILFYGIVQFLAFYNPEWMTFAACFGCLFAAWVGGLLARLSF